MTTETIKTLGNYFFKFIIATSYGIGGLLIIPDLIMYEIALIKNIFTTPFGVFPDIDNFSAYPLLGIHMILTGILLKKCHEYYYAVEDIS